MNDKVKAAIAVFDKSAERTTPNAQTEAWATLRAHIEGLEAREKFRRWNIERDGGDLLVCEGLHDGDDCDYTRYVKSEILEAAEARVRELEAWRDAVLDGNAVYAALADERQGRTSAENVSDVLDAAARVARDAMRGEGE